MKRKLVLASVAVAGFLVFSSIASAAGEYLGFPTVTVRVNGTPVDSDVPGLIIDGRTMLPVRAVAESVKAAVKWDPTTRTVDLTTTDCSDQAVLSQRIRELEAANASLKAENAELVATNASLKTKNAELKAENERLRSKVESEPTKPAPGAPGSSRTNPAPIGSTLSVTVESLFDNYTAKVTLMEVVRGDAAWQMIKSANMFNDPPKEGHEYIAARVKFELLTIEDDKALDLSPVHFKAVSASGREYDSPWVVEPEPSIRTTLYAGAAHEGWVVFEVAENDTAPVMAYGRNYDGTGGIWFDLQAP